ncbi:hypothetical protein [Sporosarcina sp. YIM B06819]|uniref:hypothetical protein n=1 Tax=Sporosarcina sp. YIM B06819 TaxID=3081769 RepID=UPI00298CD902|nr:hypothetical protein [Sporosarcina sp. YIM B06819]
MRGTLLTWTNVARVKNLAIQALHIAVQATKQMDIRNILGYFDVVLRELIDKALFSAIFKEYDTPVEGFFIR